MAGKGSSKGERRGGRKKGVPNKSRDEAKQLIDEVLKKRGGSKWIFQKLAELGEGIEMAVEEKGETRYYTKEPNPIALKTLAEYRFGKPPQEIQGDINLTSKTLIIKDDA
jgi:hypothetical protein